MNINGTEVSIIIPALNEQQQLPVTLKIIQQLFGSCKGVILADNGSTDSTVEIARSFGATVTIHPKVSIAELRNQGAKLATGDILVFIDSDVHLDSSWPEMFSLLAEKLRQNPLLVSGSRCKAGNTGDFVNRYWYTKLSQNKKTNYINSGHLIVTRTLFDMINGFDRNLSTAEDYDFCQRAMQAGATLQSEPSLIAWHNGYPRTIKAFMQREMWHGRTEYQSVSRFLSSKVAIVSILHIAFLGTCLLKSLFSLSLMPLIGYVIITAIAMFLLTAAKFGQQGLQQLLGSTIMYYLYLLARAFAWTFSGHRPAAREQADKPS